MRKVIGPRESTQYVLISSICVKNFVLVELVMVNSFNLVTTATPSTVSTCCICSFVCAPPLLTCRVNVPALVMVGNVR